MLLKPSLAYAVSVHRMVWYSLSFEFRSLADSLPSSIMSPLLLKEPLTPYQTVPKGALYTVIHLLSRFLWEFNAQTESLCLKYLFFFVF